METRVWVQLTSEEQVAAVRQYAEAGHSSSTCALYLSTTRSAVIAKGRRHDIIFRSSKGGGNNRVKQAPSARGDGSLTVVRPPRAVAKPMKPKLVAVPAGPFIPRGIALMDLEREGVCHFPLFENAKATDRPDLLPYCGHKCDGVWCSHHRRLVYQQRAA